MKEIKKGLAHPSEASSPRSIPLGLEATMNTITQQGLNVKPHSSGDLARFLRALAHKVPESARGSLYLEIAWLPPRLQIGGYIPREHEEERLAAFCNWSSQTIRVGKDKIDKEVK